MYAEAAVTFMELDITAIHDAVAEELDEERDVVVLAHSYGGLPITLAVQGLLSSDQKQKGKRGGVISIMYGVHRRLCARRRRVGSRCCTQWGH